MKLNPNPRARVTDPVLQEHLRETAKQVNAVTEGRMEAFYNATTAAPTTGTWNKGDFIRNTNPTESNTGGLKYFIHGWECTVAGTPGTWVECRFLTGGGVNITKMLTATASLDFPAISSNDTHELTMTVTGAATGDTVLMAAPSTLESGLGFSGFVTSTDTVTVRLHNASGWSVNPAAATWRATVITVA